MASAREPNFSHVEALVRDRRALLALAALAAAARRLDRRVELLARAVDSDRAAAQRPARAGTRERAGARGTGVSESARPSAPRPGRGRLLLIAQERTGVGPEAIAMRPLGRHLTSRVGMPFSFIF